MEWPLAFHLCCGTYGTRLHGDERGTVDRRMNSPGDPIIGRNDEWSEMERARLRFDPVYLTREQRLAVQGALPGICVRGGWRLHAAACQANHFHVMLSAEAEGAEVRKWLKRWLSEAMSARWPREESAAWWASGGSVKWVWTAGYYDNAMKYIDKQITAEFI